MVLRRAAALAALISAAAAQAQEALVELAPVQVTAARTAEPLADIPQAVTVVGREAIETATPQTWTDFLRGQPGAFLQSSGPGQGIVIVRGLKGSEVLHLVDGMRLNNAFFRNSPSQYIALVDPYNIERIELLRGAAGTLYGSDAMGGVVQILTPEPRFQGTDWQTSGRALARYGSADLARIGRLESAVGREGFAASAGYTDLSYGNRDAGGGHGRLEPTGYDARAYDLKLSGSVGAAQDWMFSVQAFEEPKLPRYHEVVPGYGESADSEYAWFQPNDRRFFHARYRYLAPTVLADTLEVHLARQIVNDDRSSRATGSVIDTHEDNRSTLDGLTLQAGKTFGELRLAYGLELYRDDIDSHRLDTDASTGASEVKTSRFPDGSTSDSAGVYLHGEWTASPRWLIDAGARYSHSRSELPAADRGVGVDTEDGDLSGDLGLRYALRPGLNWTANLGRAFRAPNVFDLGTLGARPGNRYNLPNPELEPERITTFDTGLKTAGARHFGEFTLFYSRYRDRIASVPTGQTREDGRIEVQSRNIAGARYYGFESGYRWRPRPPLLAYASLNYTWGEETQDGASSPANRVPPLNGQLGGLWQAGTYSCEAYVLFADRQDRLAPSDLSDPRIDPDGTGGWATVNLRGGWKPAQNWRLQLDTLNLLDQKYREHGSGIEAPGRGLVATAELHF